MRVPGRDPVVSRQPDHATLTTLCPVLAGLRFPVRTWHLLVAAEDYGASAELRNRLRQLPDRPFTSVEDVARALGLPHPVVPSTIRTAGVPA